MNKLVTRDVFYHPDHVTRAAYLDYDEDEGLRGEMDANLPADKDAAGQHIVTRTRDSQRYIDV